MNIHEGNLHAGISSEAGGQNIGLSLHLHHGCKHPRF